jgi:hypothetical protein
LLGFIGEWIVHCEQDKRLFLLPGGAISGFKVISKQRFNQIEPLTSSSIFRIIGHLYILLAMTEESKLGEAVREAGAQTETPALVKPAEVPSRAAQVNNGRLAARLVV